MCIRDRLQFIHEQKNYFPTSKTLQRKVTVTTSVELNSALDDLKMLTDRKNEIERRIQQQEKNKNKQQEYIQKLEKRFLDVCQELGIKVDSLQEAKKGTEGNQVTRELKVTQSIDCLLYTSPSPRDS
eukprot:TRINITY_DN7232_c0_g1_i1.p2 TRINITY_DN7232_c0_g1~~TRINITY_DN7232_c0_g1_i1.p2  ORF type:complete len:127 (+),score=25.75 TRINITY_DN7232_c0_g1_i1:64-444(+)